MICPLCKKQEGMLATMREELTAKDRRIAELEEMLGAVGMEDGGEKYFKELKAHNAALVAALKRAQRELGVPQPGYPQPVANAYEILAQALSQTPAQSLKVWEAERSVIEAARKWHDHETNLCGDILCKALDALDAALTKAKEGE